MSVKKELLRKKCIGALMGTFVGDALGMPFEGWHSDVIEKSYGRIEKMHEARLGKGTYTDDTQMMIAVAESLLENKGFNGEDMAQKFLENYQPGRGYGYGTVHSLSYLKSGASWDEAGKYIFEGGSYGNGSAMRIAPLAVFYAQDVARLREFAYKSSQITHAHLLGMEGATLQALAVAKAFLISPYNKFRVDDFLQELDNQISKEAGIFHQKLRIMSNLIPKRPSKATVIKELGNDSRAFQSVPTAIYCFLINYQSFEEALVYAVGLGGDTDTIAAMTGAIAGAYHGIDKIPTHWLEELENSYKGKGYVMALGNKLFDLVYK